MKQAAAPVAKPPARAPRGKVPVSAGPAPWEGVDQDPGVPLEVALRRDFESRLGHDFSLVRLHTGARAAAAAEALDAAAFSAGQHLVFGAGRFAPRTAEGRRLLAHELAHAAQARDSARVPAASLALGAVDAPEEQAADAAADAAMRGLPPRALHRATPALRRAPGWAGSKGINAKETAVGAVLRVPLDGLAVGHQPGGPGTGRAIALVPSTFDPTQPADILLHFHGHNNGYAESGSQARDTREERIEAQMQASGRSQLIGILPQGDMKSSFGTQGGQKALNTDDLVDAVLAALDRQDVVKPRPKVSGVAITGHSGAGELINEKLLGGAAGSALPSRNGPLKEVALFDAVNGPNEFAALQRFLRGKLSGELAALRALPDAAAQTAFLKTSFRFRAWYSHSRETGSFYSQWHVGPVPSTAADRTPLADLLARFFGKLVGTLDSAVVAAFRDNYQVKDAGTVAHANVVGDNSPLKEALGVMPKHDPARGPSPRVAPPEVHRTLRSPGRALASSDRTWAEAHFQRSLHAVRVHDDAAAAQSAAALNAQAYTVGRNIVFGAGRHAPGTAHGRELLAHELTHVVQQDGLNRGNAPLPDRLPVGQPGDAWEQAAERAERAPSGGAGLRVQRAGTVDAAMCEATRNDNPAKLGECNYKQPENCPTYESWIRTFTLLNSFSARDTTDAGGANDTRQKVLGRDFSDRDFAPASTPPKPAAPRTTAKKIGEEFIDHPTDDWVKTCLPANLRATAYQLPADCADVAMILRHVWLAAHHRTEKFKTWTLGSAAGRDEHAAVLPMISGEGTLGVSDMVAPYSDPATGKPLRSMGKVAPLLHPGDILVWWHYDATFKKRTGGHTHTVADVRRNAANQLTGITVLQGNEPIGGRQKPVIQAWWKANRKGKPLPTDEELGSAPGRRIERHDSEVSDDPRDVTLLNVSKDTQQPDGKGTVPIWTWGSDTLLMAAGPARAAGARPATQRVKGDPKTPPRRLTDWVPALTRAAAEAFIGTFEGMLGELRATVEGGATVPEADVRSVATAAGTAVWSRAKKAGDLAQKSHFAVLQAVLDIIAAFAASRAAMKSPKQDTAHDLITKALQLHLKWVADAFELAARGAADIDFDRGRKAGGTKAGAKSDPVNVLLTGFDPFDPSGSLRRPDPSQWNPSGAAVLALDNQRLPVADSKGRKSTTAVEGIVLPVSFDRFDDGIVEQTIGPHVQSLDAVLTVSLDPNLGPADPVRLERLAVGVRHKGGKLEGVPGTLAAAPVLETKAPLEQIADGTARAGRKGSPAVPRPTLGDRLTIDFDTPAQAAAVKARLGGAVSGSQLVLTDAARIHEVSSSMTRVPGGNGARVQFKAARSTFMGTLVSGPGGNFLSNEVSYRALRQIGAAGSARDPLSFHTHVPPGEGIPEGADAKTTKAATGRAMAQRATLIDTLKRLVTSVSTVILDRRAARKP